MHASLFSTFSTVLKWQRLPGFGQMGILGSLLLAVFSLLKLVHSFKIDTPSNIEVNALTIAFFTRLPGDPLSWKFILWSDDPNIPDKTDTGWISGNPRDPESNSIHFSCDLPGTYWMDVVTNDRSQSLIVRSNSIQAGNSESPTSPTRTPPPSPSPPPPTSTTPPSTSTTPTAEVPKSPPTTSTSEINTSSFSSSPVNNDQFELQSRTAENSMPTSSRTPNSAPTNPSALTITSSSTLAVSPTSPLIIDSGTRTLGTSSTPSPSTPERSESNQKRNKTPLIVGILIGVILFLVLLLGLIWYWNRRRQKVANIMRVTPFNGRTSPASEASTAIQPLNMNAMEEAAGSGRDTEKALEAYHNSDRPEDRHLESAYSPPPTAYSMTTLPEYPISSVSPPKYTRPLPDPFTKA